MNWEATGRRIAHLAEESARLETQAHRLLKAGMLQESLRAFERAADATAETLTLMDGMDGVPAEVRAEVADALEGLAQKVGATRSLLAAEPEAQARVLEEIRREGV